MCVLDSFNDCFVVRHHVAERRATIVMPQRKDEHWLTDFGP
jgi:hypothetical protein